MINHLLDWIFSIELGRFCFGFILIAIIVEVYVAVIIMDIHRSIMKWIRLRRLERLDEFEYRNDLY